MSMDLEVWSSRPFDLPSQLPEPEAWQRFEVPLGPLGAAINFQFAGEGWLVSATPNSRPDPPMPESISSANREKENVVYVSLEPIGASADGYAMLEKVVRSLARENNGLWVSASGDAYEADEGVF